MPSLRVRSGRLDGIGKALAEFRITDVLQAFRAAVQQIKRKIEMFVQVALPQAV